ncbi:phosphate ABC transporter substrate-binding protein [Mesorhizobium sp. Root552]|uniref:phosphate/phosphite/phosphonate ABC transporter substrate-binding protein n=1 Tax=Mesorhizobium sp. Root552 TaxID=1736555 RepID=UPI0006F2652C|nr:PhnD/SsuA/transferrin family substrate-binding protein [Mesorhizobium sp. Root552]KQZ19223.1 phosphate ABC transporter substrate-binding protein [Mesorhizobium sp. Root552]
MRDLIAALPMYDWPELRAETDGLWAHLRDALRARGIDAPEQLSRCNADLSPVSSGIRNSIGKIIAPDPATLVREDFDLPVLWRHPALLVAQTCWGPMEFGLADDVQVVGQSRYDGIEGGEGEFYSSAIVMRRGVIGHVPAPTGGCPLVPADALRGKRFAYNDGESMSGINGLKRDLEAMGESLSLFATCEESGGHRFSVRAVAEGRADVAAIDCLSWVLAQRFESAAAELEVVGWTARRKGLPFITSLSTPPGAVAALKEVLSKQLPAVINLG